MPTVFLIHFSFILYVFISLPLLLFFACNSAFEQGHLEPWRYINAFIIIIIIRHRTIKDSDFRSADSRTIGRTVVSGPTGLPGFCRRISSPFPISKCSWCLSASLNIAAIEGAIRSAVLFSRSAGRSS